MKSLEIFFGADGLIKELELAGFSIPHYWNWLSASQHAESPKYLNRHRVLQLPNN